MVDLVKLEELAKWHNEKADAAMNNLSCGSENWEYRYAHKEADFHRGFAAALSSARTEIERLRKLDAEAATHVESLIVMRTHFTGEGQHVGWRGLGLALKEHLDAKDAEIERLREALTPFAKEAFRYEPPEGDDDMKAWDSQFSIGQLRRAAAIIREQEE